MAQTNFYNANSGRAYPFVQGSVSDVDAGQTTIERLADGLIVDAGFVMGAASGFDSSRSSVWLDTVTRRGTDFVFSFVSDAPGLYNRPLGFSRPVTADTYLIEHAEESQGEYIPIDSYSAGESRDVQLGSSGSFIAPFSGRLQLYFNDDNYGDNSGSYSITINGTSYTVPHTPVGVAGPVIVRGQTYAYTASGVVRWKVYPKNQDSDPNGPLTVPKENAPSNCVCPGLVKWSLVGRIYYEGGDSEFSQSEEDEPLWGGYIVTGPLTALAALLPNEGDHLTRTDGGIVEPGLIQNLAGTFVTTINIANADRTRVTSSDGCPETQWAYPTGEDVIHVSAQNLVGNVKMRAGYNASVRQDGFDNAIVLGAAVGAGEGEPCNEVPLFSGEIAPTGSTLLTGGLRCDQLIRTLNGVGGRFLVIRAGLGVKIESDPQNNKLRINADMSQLSVCYDVSQSAET